MKYILTVLILLLANALLTHHVYSHAYLRGYHQGFESGVTTTRKTLDILIRRPGVKKAYLDGRGAH